MSSKLPENKLQWGQAGDEPAPVVTGDNYDLEPDSPSYKGGSDVSLSITKYDEDADAKVKAIVEQLGPDYVLDQIGLDELLVNVRKRISPYAAPLNDTPEKLAKNMELRFIATKMLEHTLGMFEGLSKLKAVLPPETKL